MSNISLTQLGVERLRAPPKETIFWDNNLAGFGLRVSPKGKKSFVCQYRVRGPKGSKWKERQVKLGELSFMTVAEARARARRYRAQASDGVDPAEVKKAAKQAEESKRNADGFTFTQLVARYETEYLVHRKPSGRAEKLRLLNRWRARLGDKPVAAIGETDILTFINTLLQGRTNGRYEADHLIGVVRHMFKWAKKHRDQELRSLVPINPAGDIAAQAEPIGRDRVLTHDEIKKLWAACEQVSFPGGPLVQVLLATCQRVNEVAQLRWSELDLAGKVWHLPAARSKNGRAHDIHLSDLAMEILKSLPRINGSDFVFTFDGARPFSNFNSLRNRVNDLMGADTPYWQIRDLRRSGCTLMASIGVPHHIADKVLNHTSGQISGVAAIYNRHQYIDERKAALEALGRKIAQLIGRGGAENVVPMLRA